MLCASVVSAIVPEIKMPPKPVPGTTPTPPVTRRQGKQAAVQQAAVTKKNETHTTTTNQNVDAMAKTINDLKQSVEFLSAKYDDVFTMLSEANKNVSRHEKDMKLLKNENQFLHKEVKKLNFRINALDQTQRRNAIEIHGLDLKKDEKLDKIVEDMAGQLKLPFIKEGVETVHRLKEPKVTTSKVKRPPAVLVRFTNSAHASAWTARKKTGKESRNFVEEGSTTKIFINENQSAANKELFWHSRVRGKELQYKHVWFKNGNVFMRKEDDSQILRIRSYEDLPTNAQPMPTSGMFDAATGQRVPTSFAVAVSTQAMPSTSASTSQSFASTTNVPMRSVLTASAVAVTTTTPVAAKTLADVVGARKGPVPSPDAANSDPKSRLVAVRQTSVQSSNASTVYQNTSVAPITSPRQP